MHACYLQFWYLTGELVVMALVDDKLEKGEREGLAKALHGTRRIRVTKAGKPVFPVIIWLLTPNPTPPSLSTLVTENSWVLFDRLGLTGPNVSRNILPVNPIATL